MGEWAERADVSYLFVLALSSGHSLLCYLQITRPGESAMRVPGSKGICNS